MQCLLPLNPPGTAMPVSKPGVDSTSHSGPRLTASCNSALRSSRSSSRPAVHQREHRGPGFLLLHHPCAMHPRDQHRVKICSWERAPPAQREHPSILMKWGTATHAVQEERPLRQASRAVPQKAHVYSFMHLSTAVTRREQVLDPPSRAWPEYKRSEVLQADPHGLGEDQTRPAFHETD